MKEDAGLKVVLALENRAVPDSWPGKLLVVVKMSFAVVKHQRRYSFYAPQRREREGGIHPSVADRHDPGVRTAFEIGHGICHPGPVSPLAYR